MVQNYGLRHTNQWFLAHGAMVCIVQSIDM